MNNGRRAALAKLKRIGAQLAKLRQSRDNISQNELAARSGVSQGTISNIELGRPFEIVHLLTVLNVLEREVGDFLVDAGFTDEREAYNDYIFTIKVKGKRIKAVTGNVTGPGITRATK